MIKSRVAKEPGPAVIAEGITVKGDVVGDGDIVVEGRVDGRVSLRSDLVIEREGAVEADIQARRVIVRGRVNGNIHAVELIHLGPSAVVQGNLHAPAVGVDEGAQYSGSIEMELDLPQTLKQRGVEGSPT